MGGERVECLGAGRAWRALALAARCQQAIGAAAGETGHHDTFSSTSSSISNFILGYEPAQARQWAGAARWGRRANGGSPQGGRVVS